MLLHAIPDLIATRRDDGGFELWQSPDLADDFDGRILLHPTHIALLAQSAGFVPSERVTEACERLQDRLNLLASMVRAMTADSDPLRAAVDAIFGPTPPDCEMERQPGIGGRLPGDRRTPEPISKPAQLPFPPSE